MLWIDSLVQVFSFGRLNLNWIVRFRLIILDCFVIVLDSLFSFIRQPIRKRNNADKMDKLFIVLESFAMKCVKIAVDEQAEEQVVNNKDQDDNT